MDLIDESFVVCPPAMLAASFHDVHLWRSWWPDLQLSVFMDRGDQGIRWSVAGALVGSSEVWLQPFIDGTIVHYYLRADPPMPELTRDRRRRGERLRRQQAARWKRNLNALKDEMEGGRAPGFPAVLDAPSPAPTTTLW